MAEAKPKQFWLGKGTIGDISQGEEIPEGYLSEERFRQFEKEGKIGSKMIANIDNDSEVESEVKDLRVQTKELAASLKAAEKEVKKLERENKKLTDESETVLKEENDKLKAEIKGLKKK